MPFSYSLLLYISDDIEQDLLSIGILNLYTRQYKHSEYLKFFSSLPEKPYIDQGMQEMSEMPEGR